MDGEEAPAARDGQDLRFLVTVLVEDQLVPLVHDGEQLLQQQRLAFLVGIRLLPVCEEERATEGGVRVGSEKRRVSVRLQECERMLLHSHALTANGISTGYHCTILLV